MKNFEIEYDGWAFKWTCPRCAKLNEVGDHPHHEVLGDKINDSGSYAFEGSCSRCGQEVKADLEIECHIEYDVERKDIV